MYFSERHHGVFLPKVLTWAKQHQQRLETALSELVANAELLEELLAWIQWAETTLIQRDQEPIPQNIDRVKALITEHQVPAPLCPVCPEPHALYLGIPLSLLQHYCIVTADLPAALRISSHELETQAWGSILESYHAEVTVHFLAFVGL